MVKYMYNEAMWKIIGKKMVETDVLVTALVLRQVAIFYFWQGVLSLTGISVSCSLGIFDNKVLLKCTALAWVKFTRYPAPFW